jgi:hypothetical protein
LRRTWTTHLRALFQRISKLHPAGLLRPPYLLFTSACRRTPIRHRGNRGGRQRHGASRRELRSPSDRGQFAGVPSGPRRRGHTAGGASSPPAWRVPSGGCGGWSVRRGVSQPQRAARDRRRLRCVSSKEAAGFASIRERDGFEQGEGPDPGSHLLDLDFRQQNAERALAGHRTARHSSSQRLIGP